MQNSLSIAAEVWELLRWCLPNSAPTWAKGWYYCLCHWWLEPGPSMHFITLGPSLEQLEERSHHNYWNVALWPNSTSTYDFTYVKNTILGFIITQTLQMLNLSIGIKSMDSGSHKIGIENWHCPLLALWSYAHRLFCMGLTVCIWKRGTVMFALRLLSM